VKNEFIECSVTLTISLEQAFDISRGDDKGILVTERLRGRNSPEKNEKGKFYFMIQILNQTISIISFH